VAAEAAEVEIEEEEEVQEAEAEDAEAHARKSNTFQAQEWNFDDYLFNFSFVHQ